MYPALAEFAHDIYQISRPDSAGLFGNFTADNAINGVPSCLHGDFMNGLLRKQWGYEGLIVSDQDSIRDAWAGQSRLPGHFYGNSFANVTALGIKAGCDQNDGHTYSQNGMTAVQHGLLTERDVS